MGILDVFKASSSDEVKIDMNENSMSTTGNYVSSNNKNINIDEDAALKIAALFQGITIISETLGSMQVYLHKDVDGFQTTLMEDPRSMILSGMTNEVLTSFNLKRNMIKDLILHGNAYAKIIREGNKVDLFYLPVDKVTVKKDETGYFFKVESYSTNVTGENYPSEIVDYADMLVLVKNPKYNSPIGQGLLDYAKDIFEMSIQETTYMNNLFKNGLSAKAVLSSKTPFKKEIKEKLKADLLDFYSGSNNAGKMLVLEGDISVQSLALSPSDIKLIENKTFTISEIARFLNMPKHMLNLDRGSGTYSNVTQERMMLLQQTLMPYAVAFEEALNQKLLSESEQQEGYYFQMNVNDMLKLTPQDQSDFMLNLYREGIVTLEEVRASLNLGGGQATLDELKQNAGIKKDIENDIEDGLDNKQLDSSGSNTEDSSLIGSNSNNKSSKSKKDKEENQA